MITNFNIYIFILFLSFGSCTQRKQLINEKKHFLVKLEMIGNNNQINNLGYYLLKDNFFEINSFINSNSEYNLNSIVSELVVNKRAIPVLDYPIKYWKQSCMKKKLVFPQNLTKLSLKDSLQLSKVYDNLTNPSLYTLIKLKTSKHSRYKLYIGFAEIENEDICLINWTHRISDTTAILGNKFRLKNN